MYLDDFDPFRPETWLQEKQKELTPEEFAEVKKNIAVIADKYEDAYKSRQLFQYLKFGKAELSFHRRLRKDKDFKSFVNWLVSSEQRVERAIEMLDYHIYTVKCPNCYAEFRDGEELRLSDIPFDWISFSADE